MIKKYEDNYIDLLKIDVISAIKETLINGVTGYAFDVLVNGYKITFHSDNCSNLPVLREKILKDWIKSKGDKNV